MKLPTWWDYLQVAPQPPLVVKIWTKQPWVKIENSRNFDSNFVLSRGKIRLWLFYDFFCIIAPRFYKKNRKSFQPKMKAWRRFSRILISFWIGKINVTPSFLLKMTWIFLCTIWELQCKRNYKIVIVKFCHYIVWNWNQSHANFQFFKV